MIEIETFPNRFGKRRWERLEGGPFNLTAEELSALRSRFAAEREERRSKGELDWDHAGPTMARELLKVHCPRLTDFDRLLLGYAITAQKVRVYHG